MTSQTNKFYGYVTTKDHAVSFFRRRKPVMLWKKECQIVFFIIAFTIGDKDVSASQIPVRRSSDSEFSSSGKKRDKVR